jgi:hypothetical protein
MMSVLAGLTATAVHVTVNQSTNWAYLFGLLVPGIVGCLVGLRAWLIGHSNQTAAAVAKTQANTASQVAASTATRVQDVERSVNGNLHDALQRIAAIEGRVGMVPPPQAHSAPQPAIIPGVTGPATQNKPTDR